MIKAAPTDPSLRGEFKYADAWPAGAPNVGFTRGEKLTARVQILGTGAEHPARYAFALEDIKLLNEPPKVGKMDALLRAVGLRRWVVLQVQIGAAGGAEKGYVKVNAESLRVRLGATEKEFYKEHKGVDYTEFTKSKLGGHSQSRLTNASAVKANTAEIQKQDAIIESLRKDIGKAGKLIHLSDDGVNNDDVILKKISKDGKTFTFERDGKLETLTRAKFLMEFEAGQDVAEKLLAKAKNLYPPPKSKKTTS